MNLNDKSDMAKFHIDNGLRVVLLAAFNGREPSISLFLKGDGITVGGAVVHNGSGPTYISKFYNECGEVQGKFARGFSMC